MYKMVAIGFSAGGLPLFTQLLQSLPCDYPLPLVVVLHLPAGHDSALPHLLNQCSALPVCCAQDKQIIESGKVYIAPADYHLLIEKVATQTARFALSVDEPVKAVRPSINVLFESAAEVYEGGLIAVLLSGANSDGVDGLGYVKQLGGLTIVLDPQCSEFSTMPQAAVNQVKVDYVANMQEIISLLRSVHEVS